MHKEKVGNKQVMINDKPVTLYSSLRRFGVELNGRMIWEKHIDAICRERLPLVLDLLKVIKPFEPHVTLQNLYKFFMLLYCNDCFPLRDILESVLI